MIRLVRSAAVAFVVGVVACGGEVAISPDSGAVPDASAGDGSAYPGFTSCSGPEGIALCGGSCGFDTCPKSKCLSSGGLDPKNDLAACTTGPKPDASAVTNGCKVCADGSLCAYDSDSVSKPDPLASFDRLFCGPEGYGIMYHLSGRDDLARYPDRAVYDGTRLPPPPTTCPATPGLQLCGGACGACPAQHTCMGRSPLHPYSLCAFLGWQVTSTGVACTRGNNAYCDGLTPGKHKCFVFKVDAASQPIADKNGICIDAEQCDASAQLYPGGGFCTP